MVAHSASDWPLKQLILVVRKQARVLVLLLFLLLVGWLVSVYSTLGIGMICCVQCIPPGWLWLVLGMYLCRNHPKMRSGRRRV